MIYEKPEVLAIAKAEDVILGMPKLVGQLEVSLLPRDRYLQIAEVDEST